MPSGLEEANPERARLYSPELKRWRRWGPFLSERQWGTVREDYSENGDAWSSFPHEHARSRAYRWGEDGLLGFSDEKALLCFAPALWNGQDPILKERLYGLANPEGNHGEDVKECYYYLSATPTASYIKGLYKYPQAAFPYEQLLQENARRGKRDEEFELLDTGLFDQNRYFDVFIEYAKANPDDILIRLTLANRGPEAARLDVIPTFWFRNIWSWKGGHEYPLGRPTLRQESPSTIIAHHKALGTFRISASLNRSPSNSRPPQWLFTENETNFARLYGGTNESPYVKDAFHEYVIHGKQEAVNPAQSGTKAGAYYSLEIPSGESAGVRLRLRPEHEGAHDVFDSEFDEVFERRIAETRTFYQGLAKLQDQPTLEQACAGLVWSEQFYYYKVDDWLKGDPLSPPPEGRIEGRNKEWTHVFCRDILSMPDKWEFPWFAAWDSAFQMIPFVFLDPDFAQNQMILLMREWYMHPNGQLPAYEYNFGDVNPPVHAWACRTIFQSPFRVGAPDLSFLKRVFPKLIMNFTWWLNRKDVAGKHLFTGGFLGLDNISLFDRSAKLPDGGRLEQADGTAWMALYCTEMLRMAYELALEDQAWEDTVVKFFEHFTSIREAINSLDGTGLWDDQDGFYYDHIHVWNRFIPLRVRSVVGLLPIAAAAVFDEDGLERLPDFRSDIEWFMRRRPALHQSITGIERPGPNGQPIRRRMIALPSRKQLERILRYLFDENEFLSPFGIRSLSKYHEKHPYSFDVGGQRFQVSYVPGESEDYMFGGNSNWRGPIWFPINFLIAEALGTYYRFYGDEFKVEFPTGSGRWVTLEEARTLLMDRLLSIFRPDASGRRPCHGKQARYASDPHWRDLILFNEYFHGDTGRGCGASHQTGWTGLAATLAWLFAHRTELDRPGDVHHMYLGTSPALAERR